MIKYMIEYLPSQEWLTEDGLWTHDPHAAIKFDNKQVAEDYTIQYKHMFLTETWPDMRVTEHEFISSPSPMTHKLN